MKKLVFFVDDTNDPELLNWIYSLGRSRSLVINNLLRQCMANGGIPITGAANPICRPTNTIREEPMVQNIQSQGKQKETEKRITEVKTEEPETKTDVSDATVQQVETSVEAPTQKQTGQQESEDYVSSAPKINNAGFIMAGLSAFGGV